jgi:hypothetical protein
MPSAVCSAGLRFAIEVTQQEFHAYGGTTARPADEHEWFADGAGDVIGLIAKAPRGPSPPWCGNADGTFLAGDATSDFADVHEARCALFAEMVRVGTTPPPRRATSQDASISERILADRLLAAGLTPLEVSVPHDHADPPVVFKRGTEFVTVIGVGETIDDAATDIVNQARECGLNRTVAGRWCGQTPRLGSPCSSLVGDRHRAPES